MDNKTAIGCTAIISIAVIEVVALCNGIDGVILTSVVGTISAIATGLYARAHYKKVK